MVGSTVAIVDPDGPSILETWPLLPPFLKGPVPATNKAAYGYSTDVATSPPSLAAAQVHPVTSPLRAARAAGTATGRSPR